MSKREGSVSAEAGSGNAPSVLNTLPPRPAREGRCQLHIKFAQVPNVPCKVAFGYEVCKGRLSTNRKERSLIQRAATK